MAQSRSRILVVDDDEDLRELLVRYLTDNGYDVAGAGDAAAAKRYLAAQAVDLLLLDVMLPGEDGLSLARELGGRGGPSIIMLSARGEEIDRIVGLEVGADDYLPKPFSHRELLARVAAVLRRVQRPAASGRLRHFGPFELSGAEFSLLKVLLENPDRVLSRDALVDLLKGYERAPFDRMVDVRVTRLRRKIEPDSAHPIYLRTIWGEGYMFTPSAPVKA